MVSGFSLLEAVVILPEVTKPKMSKSLKASSVPFLWLYNLKMTWSGFDFFFILFYFCIAVFHLFTLSRCIHGQPVPSCYCANIVLQLNSSPLSPAFRLLMYLWQPVLVLPFSASISLNSASQTLSIAVLLQDVPGSLLHISHHSLLLCSVAHHILPRPLTSNWWEQMTASHSAKIDQLSWEHCSLQEPANLKPCMLPRPFVRSHPSFPRAFWPVTQAAEAHNFLPADIIPCEAVSCDPLWATKCNSRLEEGLTLLWVPSSKIL